MVQVGVFKMTKRTSGVGRRVFKMTPLHHHFEMVGWKRIEDRFSVRDPGDPVRAAESFDFETEIRSFEFRGFRFQVEPQTSSLKPGT